MDPALGVSRVYAELGPGILLSNGIHEACNLHFQP